ncbi:hypothetical protein [Nocardia brasiliensis]|uniref:hypothetical protein n=1 Tax=Nocardia brasiliensis TaxID=37326 RepID=UPI0024541F01|nr:hypothetical protein [Nocardia brasiliensis]
MTSTEIPAGKAIYAYQIQECRTGGRNVAAGTRCVVPQRLRVAELLAQHSQFLRDVCLEAVLVVRCSVRSATTR